MYYSTVHTYVCNDHVFDLMTAHNINAVHLQSVYIADLCVPKLQCECSPLCGAPCLLLLFTAESTVSQCTSHTWRDHCRSQLLCWGTCCIEKHSLATEQTTNPRMMSSQASFNCMPCGWYTEAIHVWTNDVKHSYYWSLWTCCIHCMSAVHGFHSDHSHWKCFGQDCQDATGTASRQTLQG